LDFKKRLKILIALVILGITIYGAQAFQGSGTENDPYQMNHCEEIYNITLDPTAHYAVMQDLNCENLTDVYNTGVDFRGSLYGRNHTISNYYINQSPPIHTGREGGFFESIHNAYVENLIFDNFSITMIHEANEYWAYGGGVIAGDIAGNVTYNQVAIKNSYLEIQNWVSLFGSGNGDQVETIMTDCYTTDNIVISFRDYHDDEDVAVVFAAPNGETIINNTWSKDILISPPLNGGPASCFAGLERVGMEFNYFNNETCNESVYVSYGAEGITTEMFLNNSLAIWDTYDNGVWYHDEGDYPMFTWENALRVNMTSPDHNMRVQNDTVVILYNAADVIMSNFSCNLIFEDIVNQTNSNVVSAENANFTAVFPLGITEYWISCTNADMTVESQHLFYDFDNATPFIYSEIPSTFNTTVYTDDLNPQIMGNVSDISLDEVNVTIWGPNGTMIYTDYSGELNASQNEYAWNTNIDVTGYDDGNWTMFIEAVDDEEIAGLNGMNVADIWLHFEVDNCHPDWDCLTWNDCLPWGLQYCATYSDLNLCNETHSGTDLSQVCTYESSTGGGGGGASFPNGGSTEENITIIPSPPPTFSIGNFDFEVPEFIQTILNYINGMGWKESWP